jgi:SAM-dependent methyltransferase
MNPLPDPKPDWGSSYRLTAAKKWKAKSAAMGRDFTEALVEYAQPRPGMQVLDLASGTGVPAITLASRIGPTGHVTALDLSSDLLAIAAERARQRGFTNVSTQQADAQSLPFPDDRFDLATCRFGVMFFSDVERALRDLHRVLKPGARACFAAWGPKEQPYFASSIGIVHRRIGGPWLAPEGPDPFRFARPGSLSEALSRGGFASVQEETRTVPWTWPGRRGVAAAASGRHSVSAPAEASPRREVARDQYQNPRHHPPVRRRRRHQIRRDHRAGIRPETVAALLRVLCGRSFVP